MTIWIVEDEDQAIATALIAVREVIPDENLRVFSDRTMLWGADIQQIYPSGDGMPVSKLDHMPDIVILDLIDAGGDFLAGRFYEKLRAEESDPENCGAGKSLNHGQSFVVIWSPKTGMQEASRFVTNKPKIDRRLTTTNSKTVTILKEHLVRCTKSWEEAQSK